MEPKRLLLIVLAVLLAGGSFLFFRQALQPRATASTSPPSQVLVASTDLPAGTMLKAADLSWRDWPANAVNPTLITKNNNTIDQYVGSVVRIGLRTGEPLNAGRVLKRGEQGFLASILEPGMRAISVKITPVTGVSGLVFPGDRVDVILTHTLSQGEESRATRRVAETVVKNARVLAIDQRTDDQNQEAKLAETATLEVTPDMAEKVALMADWGTMALALRPLANDPVSDASDNPNEYSANTTDTTPTDTSANSPPADNGISLPSLDSIMSKATNQETGPDQLPPVLRQSGTSLTWDSDVSAALPAPGANRQTQHRVQIIRGNESSEATFAVSE